LQKIAPEITKAGMEVGLGLGQTTDSVDWTGALLRAYGAELVDAKGNIKVRSDQVREVLEYLAKLTNSLPADTFTYDDASNNKTLIAGRAALIFNPPSAWFVARRDNETVAADCWTFPSPSGPKGRFIPHQPYYWGIWKFSQNINAAKDLLSWLMQRSQVEPREVASVGYDIPPFDSMHNFTVWSEVKPPLGTVYNYPIRPWHHSVANIAGYPAPPHIGTQLYSNGTFNVMVEKLTKGGQKMNDVLAWAEQEIEGYANM
jgi:Bacterial extracellular solute-binding protein